MAGILEVCVDSLVSARSAIAGGAEASCLLGTKTTGKLLRLRNLHNGPKVLISGGVKPHTIIKFKTLFPQAKAFHMSGQKEIENSMIFRRNGVPVGTPGLDEWHIQQTDKQIIPDARYALDAQ